jgi:hypothetical protein
LDALKARDFFVLFSSLYFFLSPRSLVLLPYALALLRPSANSLSLSLSAVRFPLQPCRSLLSNASATLPFSFLYVRCESFHYEEFDSKTSWFENGFRANKSEERSQVYAHVHLAGPVSQLRIERCIRFLAIQHDLVAPYVSCDVVQRLHEAQSELLAAVSVSGHDHVFDVTGTTARVDQLWLG